ncbi:MAG: DNA cytosine methyltransferase [Geitlerinemataceae cyanobacterium]
MYRIIDLFSGAGGMSLGFFKEFGNEFQSVWANDCNIYAAKTYNRNFGEHCVVGDIVSLLKKSEIPQADIVLGGPPCQGFSLLNKKREKDERKSLWQPYLEVVRRAGASYFLMENVPQLLGSPEHKAIIKTSGKLGFRTISFKLLAADYGVPQRRSRAFIIGSRWSDPHICFPPPKTHYDPSKNQMSLLPEDELTEDFRPWRTVRDAIGDLDEPIGTQIRDVDPPYNLQFGRNPTELSKARYRAVPEEGMNRFDLQRNAPELTPKCWLRKKSGSTDLFGRLWWDKPAFTIRTEFYKPEKGRYLHPSQHRPITHREAARLQSFPDSFHFEGTKIEIARQIGNAVPPLMAASLASAMRQLISDSLSSRGQSQQTP